MRPDAIHSLHQAVSDPGYMIELRHVARDASAHRSEPGLFLTPAMDAEREKPIHMSASMSGTIKRQGLSRLAIWFVIALVFGVFGLAYDLAFLPCVAFLIGAGWFAVALLRDLSDGRVYLFQGPIRVVRKTGRGKIRGGATYSLKWSHYSVTSSPTVYDAVRGEATHSDVVKVDAWLAYAKASRIVLLIFKSSGEPLYADSRLSVQDAGDLLSAAGVSSRSAAHQ